MKTYSNLVASPNSLISLSFSHHHMNKNYESFLSSTRINPRDMISDRTVRLYAIRSKTADIYPGIDDPGKVTGKEIEEARGQTLCEKRKGKEVDKNQFSTSTYNDKLSWEKNMKESSLLSTSRQLVSKFRTHDRLSVPSSSSMRFYSTSNGSDSSKRIDSMKTVKSPMVSRVEDEGYMKSFHLPSFYIKKMNQWFGRKPPGTLILVRHGETFLNYSKTFTGWTDTDLSDRGIREMEHAARLLLERGFQIDVTYTSRLKRAIRSVWILSRELNQIYRPVFKSWRLNERMYGALEGLSKPGCALELGEDIVQEYRIGLHARPPPMTPEHPSWHRNRRQYADLNPEDIPVTESLQDTMDRTLPLWNSRILPDLLRGRTVLICAHANSLRGIVKHIDGLTENEITQVAIPNGIPLVYKFDSDMNPIRLEGAVQPIRGEFLEKKGLLRTALAKEAELTRKVPGFQSLSSHPNVQVWLDPRLRGLSKLMDTLKLVELDTLKTRKNANVSTEQPDNDNLSGNSSKIKDGLIEKYTSVSSMPQGLDSVTSEKIKNSKPIKGKENAYSMNGAPGGRRYTEEQEKEIFASIAESRETLKQYLAAASNTATNESTLDMAEPSTEFSKEDANALPKIQIQQVKMGSATNAETSERLVLPLFDDDIPLTTKDPATNNTPETDIQYGDHGNKISDEIGIFTYNNDDPERYRNLISLQDKETSTSYEKDKIELAKKSVDLQNTEEKPGLDVQNVVSKQKMIKKDNLSGIKCKYDTMDESDNNLGSTSTTHLDITGDERAKLYKEKANNFFLDRMKSNELQSKSKSTKRKTSKFNQKLNEKKFKNDRNRRTINNDSPSTDIRFDISGQNKSDASNRWLDDQIIVIIRHGKTEYNKLGIFTGWEDAPLAQEGKIEATEAGRLLKRHGIDFDVVYTSWLSRAIETAWLVLDELDSLWLPIIKSWRLNERMYGALTGLSKKMIAQQHGEEKFKEWRRSFATKPPAVSSFSSHYPGNDDRYVKYADDLRISVSESIIRSLSHMSLDIHRKFPKTESLKDCMQRTIPYFTDTILPESVEQGKTVLIASSENAIRGLLMHLCDIPADKISSVEIPTGLPLVFSRKKKCIQLLETGNEDPYNPLKGYNFGSNPELLFRPCDEADGSECFIALPTDSDGVNGDRNILRFAYDPLIRLPNDQAKEIARLEPTEDSYPGGFTSKRNTNSVRVPYITPNDFQGENKANQRI